MKTDLTFFCELDGVSLQKLFENRFIFDDLKSLGASLSMGVLDFSDERVGIVRKLNKLGIPVRAWLLLPKEKGYWFNLKNSDDALKMYAEFKRWSRENGLEWSGIGLDIEPDINEMSESLKRPFQSFAKALARLKDKAGIAKASADYRRLAVNIRDDGYFVESYHFPFIVDERRAKSTVIQRFSGVVDVPVDREVLMLYSSFFRPIGQNILWSYAQQAEAIGLGNTGGGVKLEGRKKPEVYLSWEEFSTDLRLAWKTGKPLYIFSLEGCVEQGFLTRLVNFDWAGEVKYPRNALLNTARGGLGGLLWLLQRPFIALAGLAGLIGAVIAIRSGKRREKKL